MDLQAGVVQEDIGYIAFFKNKQDEVYVDTSYEAQ
jgi:hypothetical protein